MLAPKGLGPHAGSARFTTEDWSLSGHHGRAYGGSVDGGLHLFVLRTLALAAAIAVAEPSGDRR